MHSTVRSPQPKAVATCAIGTWGRRRGDAAHVDLEPFEVTFLPTKKAFFLVRDVRPQLQLYCNSDPPVHLVRCLCDVALRTTGFFPAGALTGLTE